MMNIRVLKIGLLLTCLISVSLAALWVRECYLAACRIREDHRADAKFEHLTEMLLTYHREHGAFPPTKYQPSPGGPIHSWRVLLLPYTCKGFMERPQYDFSQQWNSTDNMRVPDYGYFSVEGEGAIAHYLAISDDDEWPSRKPLKSRLITQGKDRFLLVEHPDSTIHWMEPRY